MPSPHSHLSSRVKQSSLQSLGIQAGPTHCPGRSYFSRLFKWSPGGSSRPLSAPSSFGVVGTVGKAGSTAPSGATFWTHLRLPRGIILLALSCSPRTRSQIEKCYVISNSFFFPNNDHKCCCVLLPGTHQKASHDPLSGWSLKHYE